MNIFDLRIRSLEEKECIIKTSSLSAKINRRLHLMQDPQFELLKRHYNSQFMSFFGAVYGHYDCDDPSHLLSVHPKQRLKCRCQDMFYLHRHTWFCLPTVRVSQLHHQRHSVSFTLWPFHKKSQLHHQRHSVSFALWPFQRAHTFHKKWNCLLSCLCLLHLRVVKSILPRFCGALSMLNVLAKIFSMVVNCPHHLMQISLSLWPQGSSLRLSSGDFFSPCVPHNFTSPWVDSNHHTTHLFHRLPWQNWIVQPSCRCLWSWRIEFSQNKSPCGKV